MSGPATDLNLLKALLAFQNGFVNRSDLLAAFGAWVADKSVSITDLLVRQQKLSREQQDLIDALAVEHLKQHSGDLQESLASLSSVESGWQIIKQISDSDIQQTLSQVQGPVVQGTLPFEAGRFISGGSNEQRPSTPTSTAPESSERQRFRILRPHAKGGLGEVFVARDTELNREVALKEIQEQFSDHPDSRSRFLLEAEITGGLEHPGIVPVYGLGLYADGRPFYAMRFIKGDSLKEAIERFHQKRRDLPNYSTGEAGIEFRQLLGRFIDVCQAIEYAHSRGVLHRDLKPGNIMLGKYGETLVVDWGLAKVVGRSEHHRSTGEATLTPESGSGSAATQVGLAIGTPSFMSPEQAAGNLSELGPATDVYSLGATLYCLLTGKVPFAATEAGGMQELLRKVQLGSFRPPREIFQEIPRPLEAICLKAMANEPSRRYPSPQAIATDIENWLADEPVKAFPESFVSLAQRWIRKHQAMTAGLVMTVLVGLIALATSATLIGSKNRQLAESASVNEREQNELRKQAERQRDLAVQTLYTARVNLMEASWRNAEVKNVRKLLELTTPAAGEPDLRGFEWYYWRHVADNCLLTLKTAGGWRTDVRFSGDGERIASCNAGRVQVWDTSSGKQIVELPTTNSTCVAFNGDGSWIATGGDNEAPKVTIWDSVSGKPITELGKHADTVRSIAFSPDGKNLASASYDYSCRVWDIAAKKEVFRLPSQESEVDCVTYSSDGKLIAAGYSNGTLLICAAEDGTVIHEIAGHDWIVWGLCFSREGNLLASASEDGTIKGWDPKTGERKLFIGNIPGPVLGVAVDDSASVIIGSSQDRTVRVFDARTGTQTNVLRGHEGEVEGLALHPDGHRVVTSSKDGTVKLWDIRDSPEFRTLTEENDREINHTSNVECLQYVDGGRTLLSSADQLIRWDSRTGTPQNMLSLKRMVDEELSVLCTDISSDGKFAAAGMSNGTLLVWDLSSQMASIASRVSSEPILAVKLSLGSQEVTCRTRDDQLHVIPLDAKGPVRHVNLDSYAASLLAVTSDGSEACFVGKGGLHIAHLKTGKERILPVAESTCAVFSKDGALLFCSSKTEIQVWHTESLKMLRNWIAHEETIFQLALSDDEQRIVSGSRDNTARLWDAVTGQQLLTLRGFKNGVTQVAMSPNGQQIATVSDAMKIQLWDGPRVFTAGDRPSE